jgi:hypothetical protein
LFYELEANMNRVLLFLLICLQNSVSAEPLTGQAIENIGVPSLQVEMPRVAVTIKRRPSAIGISWDWNSGIITYIDPTSSVCGQAQIGDQILLIAGVDRRTAKIHKLYLGPEGSCVPIIVRQRTGQIVPIMVMRQPIENFSLEFQRGLAY